MYYFSVKNSHHNLAQYGHTNSMDQLTPGYRTTDRSGEHGGPRSSPHRSHHNTPGDMGKFSNMRDPELKEVRVC